MRQFYALNKVTTKEEKIKMCYAFLSTDVLFYPEVTIMNKEGGSEFIPGMVFPTDLPLITYTKENLPTWEEFYNTYKEKGYGLTCVASFNKDDTDRVTLMYMEDDELEKTNTDIVASMEANEIIRNIFFQALDEECKKIK